MPIFDIFSSESYPGYVGDCFLESGRLPLCLKEIFWVDKTYIYIFQTAILRIARFV